MTGWEVTKFNRDYKLISRLIESYPLAALSEDGNSLFIIRKYAANLNCPPEQGWEERWCLAYLSSGFSTFFHLPKDLEYTGITLKGASFPEGQITIETKTVAVTTSTGALSKKLGFSDHLSETERMEVFLSLETQIEISSEKPKKEYTFFSEEIKEIQKKLKDSDYLNVEKFICKDWNVFYNLYNPENFGDPNNLEDWEDNSECFTKYESPSKHTTIEIFVESNDLSLFNKLYQNKETIEQKLLNYFEEFTFKDAFDNVEGKYYEWAKIEIERFEKTTYTTAAFLKRNLRLESIILRENELKLHFECSWDEEHGTVVSINENLELEESYL